jgi:hypothetical protein
VQGASARVRFARKPLVSPCAFGQGLQRQSLKNRLYATCFALNFPQRKFDHFQLSAVNPRLRDFWGGMQAEIGQAQNVGTDANKSFVAAAHLPHVDGQSPTDTKSGACGAG